MTTMLFMVFLLPSAVLSFVNQPSKLSPCVRRQAVQQQQMTMVYDEYDVEGKRALESVKKRSLNKVIRRQVSMEFERGTRTFRFC